MLAASTASAAGPQTGGGRTARRAHATRAAESAPSRHVGPEHREILAQRLAPGEVQCGRLTLADARSRSAGASSQPASVASPAIVRGGRQQVEEAPVAEEIEVFGVGMIGRQPDAGRRLPRPCQRSFQPRETGLDVHRGPAALVRAARAARAWTTASAANAATGHRQPPRRQPPDAKGGDRHRQRCGRDRQPQVAELQVTRVERGDRAPRCPARRLA